MGWRQGKEKRLEIRRRKGIIDIMVGKGIGENKGKSDGEKGGKENREKDEKRDWR